MGFKAPSSTTADLMWTLPNEKGAPQSFLSTDGFVNLSWRAQTVASVSSVAGRTGDVTLTSSDVTEGSRLFYTDARARAAISAAGPLVYNSTAGIVSLAVASSVSDGYLSAADYVNFNNKQNSIGYTPLNKAGDTIGGELKMASKAPVV